jgi:WD40 repeat protein
LKTLVSFYELFGVRPDADTDTIRRAYRLLARKFHPDVSNETNAHETMARLNEAFKTLSDPDRRAEYDAMLAGGGGPISTSSPTSGTAKPSKPVVVKLRHRLHAHKTPIYAVSFAPDSQNLITSGFDNEILWWHEDNVVQRAKLDSGVISVMKAFPEGRLVAAGAAESQILFWHLNGPMIDSWKSAGEEWVSCLAISADGKNLATGSLHRTLAVNDTWNGKSVYRKQEHEDAVTAIAYSNDGKYIASGSADATVKLFDAQTGALIHTFRQVRTTVTSVAFSPDNRFLAVAAVDLSIRVFSLQTGSLEKMMFGHTKPIESMAFHPNSWLLASGSRDGTLGLWNAAKGIGNVRMEVSPKPLACVTFSMDGRRLAAGGQDKIVRIWDVQAKETA